ncbi:hypothetical protein [Taklimakanibacter deserti]|uniref:hypothetical protein n=1 Tax=Taklimakanibacter deserti TaxID=2267839 RepID=UPI000E652828
MVKVPDTSPAQLKLFVGYSRFECALKECGYVVPKAGIAHADWKRFAGEECLKDVMEIASDDADVKEMIADPPATQVTDGDGTWRWAAQIEAPIDALGQFFEAVKQVRDNLFHGGKHGENRERDDTLCRAAWVVLELCAERHPEVGSIFEYKY